MLPIIVHGDTGTVVHIQITMIKNLFFQSDLGENKIRHENVLESLFFEWPKCDLLIVKAHHLWKSQKIMYRYP